MDVHALFLVVLLHALILFSATSAAIAAALDNSTDLSSLLAFKAASTSGGGASDNIISANWTTDAPFCTWVGVGCSRRRPRVVSLNLSSFSLQGVDRGMVCETRSRYRLHKLARFKESVGDNFCYRRSKMSSGEKMVQDEDIGLWSLPVENAFVSMMDAEVAKNNLKSSTFSIKIWQNFVVQLKSQLNRNFSVKQLKDKYSRLRIKFREFEKLKDKSGFGWDSHTNTVTAENDVWDNYIQANPGAKVFRTKGMSNYEALSRIFKLSTATGLLSRASTQRPLDSDEERAIDDEFANPDTNTRSHPIMCDGLDDIGIESTIGDRRKAKGQSSKRPTKSPKTSKLDKCMDAITSASNAKTEKFVKAQAALEQFSMSKCMDVFNTMEGIPTNQGIKALDVLANSAIYREAFLKMKEDFRRAWVMGLGSSD